MSLRVEFRPEAEADLLNARDWYEEQQAGVGEMFWAAVESAVTRISAMPEMYVKTLRDFRRAKIRKFPYVIYYRVLSDRIEMIAVLHASRDPHLWQERVN